MRTCHSAQNFGQAAFINEAAPVRPARTCVKCASILTASDASLTL
jgi:hypothetical protein